MHLEPVPQVPDVVQRPARGCAHECVHDRTELDQRVGQVRPHEAVRPGHQHGATAIRLTELGAELLDRGVGPGGVGHGAYASRSVSKRTGSSGLGSLGSGALTAAALAVQTGLAAVVGVIVARHFGRTAVTDGFFASYGVFATLGLAATAARGTRA